MTAKCPTPTMTRCPVRTVMMSGAKGVPMFQNSRLLWWNTRQQQFTSTAYWLMFWKYGCIIRNFDNPCCFARWPNVSTLNKHSSNRNSDLSPLQGTETCSVIHSAYYSTCNGVLALRVRHKDYRSLLSHAQVNPLEHTAVCETAVPLR
jgi:hypothetical protein